MRLSLTKRRVITALAVWFVTRAVLYLVATEHFLGKYGKESVGDVSIYLKWAQDSLYYGQIPHDTEWQYPPLLAPILVFPEWLSHTIGIHYLTGFTAMTFLADCVITAMLIWTATRRDPLARPCGHHAPFRPGYPAYQQHGLRQQPRYPPRRPCRWP